MIVSNLWTEFVNFPEIVNQMVLEISLMEDKCQLPGAFGGVNNCHIPMKFPCRGHEARKENHNFKNFILSL